MIITKKVLNAAASQSSSLLKCSLKSSTLCCLNFFLKHAEDLYRIQIFYSLIATLQLLNMCFIRSDMTILFFILCSKEETGKYLFILILSDNPFHFEFLFSGCH